MDAYHPKRRLTLSFAGRNGRDFIAVAFGGDASLRERLTQEPGAIADGGAVFIPADGFVLADFFDRYVGDAFIDYSAIKAPEHKAALKSAKPYETPLPDGYDELLRQMRYSSHTVRAYRTYFREFMQYFAGRSLRSIKAREINDYIVDLIDTRGISSCQQNLRINAIKFYYEKVLGRSRQYYEIKRAKREKTLPDVLSKAEIKAILDATHPDLRLYCMLSLLYSAGLRISELLALKPDDINVSRSLIRVRQGKGRKDRFTLLSKPLLKKLAQYRSLYKPKEWMFERTPGEPFTESIVSKRLKAAAREAGITKRIYPHLLRHSFATHLIEQGTDLKIVQELLGHNSVKTTEMYVHIADNFKSSIRTPLDDILENDNEDFTQRNNSQIR